MILRWLAASILPERLSATNRSFLWKLFLKACRKLFLTSAATSVAEGFIAAPLLAATGHFMNDSKIIGEPGTAYDGLHQPTNLFVALVGFSGTNKTSALGVIEKAASRIEPSSLNNCKYK